MPVSRTKTKQTRKKAPAPDEQQHVDDGELNEDAIRIDSDNGDDAAWEANEVLDGRDDDENGEEEYEEEEGEEEEEEGEEEGDREWEEETEEPNAFPDAVEEIFSMEYAMPEPSPKPDIPTHGETTLLDGQGYIALTDYMGDELKIVNAARIAYNARSGVLSRRDKAILTSLLSNGHTSPLEQVTFTFFVKAPIFVARQWFRHRTWSYNEMSRRYTKTAPEFYVPRHFTGGYLDDSDIGVVNGLAAPIVHLYDQVARTYWWLMSKGVKPEQARVVLPVATMTEFFATVNLNNLLKFIALRDDIHAQYEIREYAHAMKGLVKPLLPTIAEAMGW